MDDAKSACTLKLNIGKRNDCGLESVVHKMWNNSSRGNELIFTISYLVLVRDYAYD